MPYTMDSNPERVCAAHRIQKRTHYRTTVFERRSSGMSDKSLLPYVQTKVVWSDMELVTTRRLQIWRAPRATNLEETVRGAVS